MDFDDVNIPGILFAIIAFGIGIIISKSMDSGVLMRVISGFVCAIAAYFIGGKIAES